MFGPAARFPYAEPRSYTPDDAPLEAYLALLDRLGFAPELIELPPARALEEPCIVRGSVGAGPRTVYFHGHFDVVPAQSRAQFEPRREGGRTR